MVSVINFLFFSFLLFKLLFIIFNFKHLLMILLMFELVNLNILMCLFFSWTNFQIYFTFVFLVVIACEASVGLSLLVGVIRSKLKSYVSGQNIFVH